MSTEELLMVARTSRADQKDRTRQAILDTAMELYAEKGYRGTGLIAIGEKAGVHHSTILYHFGSSAGLLVAVLNERDRQFLELTRPIWGQGALTALRDLPAMARFNVANPQLARLFTVLEAENLDEHGPAHQYFLRRRRMFHDLIVALIQYTIDAEQLTTSID